MGDPEMYEKTMNNDTSSIQFSFRFYKKKKNAWESHGGNDGNRVQTACTKEAKTKKMILGNNGF